MPLIHSTTKRDQAVYLRGSGKNLRSIAKELKISTSTVQLWTKNVILSDEQKQNIANEHRHKLMAGQSKFIKQRKAKKIENELATFTEAKNEIVVRKSDSFFIMGLALYW